MAQLFIDNPHIAKVSRVRDDDGNYDNAATVTLTVYDSANAEVPGQSWPLTLDYVAGTQGNYEGAVSSALTFIEHYQYRFLYAVTSNGVTATKELNLIAAVRDC